MVDTALGRQIADSVRQAVAEAAAYVALVIQTNPRGSADALLKRPDISAVLQQALDAARGAAEETVQQAWQGAGAPGEHETLGHLLTDVSRLFGDIAHLRGLVRHAHASVPQRQFVRGVTPPGENPSQRAAEERAEAVRRALAGWARSAALRARMAVQTAEGAASAAAVLADALAREERGEKLRKRWRAHVSSPSCCFWCRRLNGVTIGLRESFEPYLGGPVAMLQVGPRYVRTPAGERRFGMPAGTRIIYTHPPRPYRGKLQGPLLHPFCRCWLEVVRAGGAEIPAGDERAAQSAGFLSAADVRAMPEDVYQADVAFLNAALDELDQVLKRLAGGSD